MYYLCSSHIYYIVLYKLFETLIAYYVYDNYSFMHNCFVALRIVVPLQYIILIMTVLHNNVCIHLQCMHVSQCCCIILSSQADASGQPCAFCDGQLMRISRRICGSVAWLPLYIIRRIKYNIYFVINDVWGIARVCI